MSKSYESGKLGKARNYQVQNLKWHEYAAEAKDGLIILPTGSTEQHAYHLPICVDFLLAERFSLQLAERVNAWVAPTVNYGYKSQPSSGGGPLFPGTVDLQHDTMVRLIHDILKELRDDGWKKILILNAHFENTSALMEAADILTRYQTEEFPKIIVTAWYDHVTDDVIPTVWNEVPFKGWALEHAAILETSAMLYYAPELVDESAYLEEGLDSLPNYSRFPPDPTLISSSGTLAWAKSSSAEKGKLMIECALKNIEELIHKEL